MREKLTSIKFVEDMVDYTLRQNSKAKPSMVYLMVLKHLADIVSRGRVRVKRRKDDALASFSFMLFSRTAGGKDRTNKDIHTWFFSGATEVYEQALENAYKSEEKRVFEEAQKRYPEEREKPQRDYHVKMHSPRQVGVSSDTLTTPEGYVADRVAIYKYPFGAISVIDAELGDTLESFDKSSKTLFSLMKKAWDDGYSSNKSIKMEKVLKEVKNVPMSFLGYSTTGNFKKTKAGEELLKLLTGGWLRRSLIAYDASLVKEAPPPKIKTMEEYQSESDQEAVDDKNNSSICEYIGKLQTKLIHNAGMILHYTDEAGLRYENFEREMKHEAEKQLIKDFNVESLRITNFEGRAWLVFRLAGLLAVIQNKAQVDLSDLEDAIKVVDFYSKQAMQLVEFIEKPSLEDSLVSSDTQVLFEIAEQKGFFNLTDVKKILKRTNYERLKDSLIDDVSDFAMFQGKVFVLTKVKNEVRYMLEKLTKSEDVIVSMSVSESCHNAEGYEWHEETDLTLQTAVALSTCGNYSAGKFEKNYRSVKTWLGGNTMLIYDVDNGTTIEEAKSMFLDTPCAIMPTKSHQKEKNGVVCDRFRVFLPLAKPIDFTDAKRFKRIMKNVSESFNLAFDTATADPSRMFFKADLEALDNIWYSDYALHYIDWRMFDYETMGEQELKQVARMHNATFRAENKSKETIVKAVTRLCENRYHDGNRNNTLFRALRWLKDAGFTQSEAEDLMLNVTRSSPLPVDEFKATVRSAWR